MLIMLYSTNQENYWCPKFGPKLATSSPAHSSETRSPHLRQTRWKRMWRAGSARPSTSSRWVVIDLHVSRDSLPSATNYTLRRRALCNCLSLAFQRLEFETAEADSVDLQSELQLICTSTWSSNYDPNWTSVAWLLTVIALCRLSV